MNRIIKNSNKMVRLIVVKSCPTSYLEIGNVSFSDIDLVNVSALTFDEKEVHSSFVPTKSEVEKIRFTFNGVYFFEPLIKGQKVDYSSLRESGIEESEILKSLKELKDVISSLPSDEELIFLDFTHSGDIVTFLTKMWMTFREETKYYLSPSSARDGYSAVFRGDFEINFNPFVEFNIPFKEYPAHQRRKYCDFLIEMCFSLEKYISLGFTEGTINYFHSSKNYWVFNLQSFVLKSLITFFGIHSPYSDRKDIPLDEFLINKDYRFTLTEMMAKVMANIAILSDLKVSPPKITVRGREKVVEWFDESYYSRIRRELSSIADRD